MVKSTSEEGNSSVLALPVFCGEFILLKEASDEQKRKIAPIIPSRPELIPVCLHGLDPSGR
jgi:hypothetical protein